MKKENKFIISSNDASYLAYEFERASEESKDHGIYTFNFFSIEHDVEITFVIVPSKEQI